MKRSEGIKKKKQTSIRLLCSYLAIILAPAAAILVVYMTMQRALLEIQKEKAQNLTNEAAVTFNKEVEQLSNVARYITYDAELKKYMDERIPGISPEAYYQAYELAKEYPEYALLNRFVKNIYILPLQTSYLMEIPRVVPNNQRGVSMLDMVTEEVEYEEMVKSLYDLGWAGTFYGKGKGVSESFLVVQRFDYSENGEKAGVVVIELDQKELKRILSQILGSDTGMVFLVDDDENILYLYDDYNHVSSTLEGSTLEGSTPEERMGWEDYLEAYGWSGRTVTVNRVSTGVNKWSVITAMPREALLSKIGAGKTAVLFLCIISLLIGVAICLLYWNSNQPVVEHYVKYAEKHPDAILPERESANIWKNFGGVLDHAETMQAALDKHRQWVKEQIIRKILFGSYDSEQELENELKEAGVEFPVELPCVLAGLEIENPMKQNVEVDIDALESALKQELDEKLPGPYLMVNMAPLSYILLIYTRGVPLGERNLKELFENINYALYSRIPVNIFTGISNEADTALTIAEEYEHVCRCCEYARYYKLRVPCLSEELPLQQPVVFTVELEIQLEKTIRNGTREQLKSVMAQVEDNYFRSMGGVFTANYNLELLRGILLRTLSDQEKEAREELLEKVHAVRAPWEMEECIEQVWQYFEERRLLCQDQDLEELKEEIEKNMERGYPSAEFNLAVMAEWMDIPEKRLYRDFRKMYGVSFTSYLEMKRTQYAQEMLKENRPIGEVAQAVGYSSDYSFRRAFKRVVGVTPSDYQRMQENNR